MPRSPETIPLTEEFIQLLQPEGFPSTSDLYHSYVASPNRKNVTSAIPSSTGFARFLARVEAPYRTQEAGLRGCKLKFHHV